MKRKSPMNTELFPFIHERAALCQDGEGIKRLKDFRPDVVQA